VNIIQILNCLDLKMSCGNRFQCGLSKPSRFQFQPDKPSNPQLHNENQQRLNDLLKAREDIDKQFFSSQPKASETTAIITNRPTHSDFTNSQSVIEPEKNNNFTAWKTPSADWKSK
jgi:hypothetical protein